MPRRRDRVGSSSSSSSDNEDVDDSSDLRSSCSDMKCVSCKEEYSCDDAGTCRECYEEAGETEEELKRQIDDLKAKVKFLRLSSTPSTYSDVVLVPASDQELSFKAHRLLLASRSPVFKAMLENEMEESLSRTIKMSDVSPDALRAFIGYLYTAEACLDEPMACEVLVLAEKYQVKHMKSYCEKFLISKLNWENSILNYAFAHQQNAKSLLDGSLSVIMDNMDKLGTREEYKQLVEKDPRLVVEIYEAYLSKQANTAASLKDTPPPPPPTHTRCRQSG